VIPEVTCGKGTSFLITSSWFGYRPSSGGIDDCPRLGLPASKKPRLGKRPYRKPEFCFERVFETQALACGKISYTQAQCKLNLRSS